MPEFGTVAPGSSDHLRKIDLDVPSFEVACRLGMTSQNSTSLENWTSDQETWQREVRYN